MTPMCGSEQCVRTVSSGSACADRMLDTPRRMTREVRECLARVAAVLHAGETVDHTPGMSLGVDHVSADAC